MQAGTNLQTDFGAGGKWRQSTHLTSYPSGCMGGTDSTGRRPTSKGSSRGVWNSDSGRNGHCAWTCSCWIVLVAARAAGIYLRTSDRGISVVSGGNGHQRRVCSKLCPLYDHRATGKLVHCVHMQSISFKRNPTPQTYTLRHPTFLVIVCTAEFELPLLTGAKLSKGTGDTPCRASSCCCKRASSCLICWISLSHRLISLSHCSRLLSLRECWPPPPR